MPLPTTSECIDNAEAQLGVALPERYRVHLMTENGGEVAAGGETWQVFPVFDTSDRRRLARSSNHIVRETAEARKSSGFPAFAIAIGFNGSGDYLVCVPEPGDSGCLGQAFYVWSHETRGLTPAVVTWESRGI